MWNPISKLNEKNNFPNYSSRIHVDHPLANTIFQANLTLYLTKLYNPVFPLIILCIGTDRSTGDSLGPLIGTKLSAEKTKEIHIFGTLDEPVHAVNLPETIEHIYQNYQNPFILAIDACLGRTESVGYISVKEGSLQPGTGVNKELPSVGDLQIIGIVNVGGFMEYMVLQNTRLSLVMKMANIISEGINQEVKKFFYSAPTPIEPPQVNDELILS